MLSNRLHSTRVFALGIALGGQACTGPQFTTEGSAAGKGGVGAGASSSSGSGSGGESSTGATGGGTAVSACVGPPQWVKRYGDARDQVGMSVAADAAGDIAIAGVFKGSIDFGGGPLTAPPNAYGIYVAKLDAGGDLLWSHAYPGGIDYVAGEGLPFATVAVTPAGGVIFGGELSGTVDFGAGPAITATSTIGDGFVVAFDPAGAPLWSVHYGDAPPTPATPPTPIVPQTVESLSVDAMGNVLVLGYRGWGTGGGMFLAKLDSQGNELWRKSISSSGTMESTVRADPDGNVIVAGLAYAAVHLGGAALPTSTAFPTLFSAKLDPAGNPLWSRGAITMGLNLHPGNGLGVDALGNVFVAGGGGDFNLDVGCGVFPTAWTTKVMEFDGSSGDCRWTAGFADFGAALAVDASGRAIVATDTANQIVSYPPSTGVPGAACVDTLAPSGSIALYGFAAAPAGHVLMTGAFSGAAALEGGPATVLQSAGMRDVFLASF